MMKLRTLVDIVLGLPKAMYLNFKLLPFNQAIKLPILCSHRVKIASAKGSCTIESPVKFGMIKIGLAYVGSWPHSFQDVYWQIDGKVVFHGRATLGGGSTYACIFSNSVLNIGNAVNFMGGVNITSSKAIEIGENCNIYPGIHK